MISPTRWFGPPRHVLTLFLSVMIILGAALSWLGWQLFDQDRALERQRRQERLDQAANHIADSLRRFTATADSYLGFVPKAATPNPPDGLVVLRTTENELTTYPPGSLLFYPLLPAATEAPAAAFAEGEAFEHRQNDPARAAQAYRTRTGSKDPAVRAGAWLRLGRALRKSGRNEEALKAYAELALCEHTRLMELPAALVALEARCGILEALGRNEELKSEAAAMYSALAGGRWILLRPSWEFYLTEARRWTGGGEWTEPQKNALALSHAAEWVHARWLAARESPGRNILIIEGRPVFISWTTAHDRLDAVMAGAGYLDAWWNGLLQSRRAQGALLDGEGRILIGSTIGGTQFVTRPSTIAGLPWTLRLAAIDPAMESMASSLRRRLLLAGFAILALVLLSGSYFILRSISRELAVARLQSEFVSTVSHEFRTPLTSLRQLSEMLSKGRIPLDEQKQQSYDILSRESERLQRLVESLLDFGRMEARAFRYLFQDIDPSALVNEVVGEFRTEAADRGYQVELEDSGPFPAIRADREALGLALWNLLDNAVKYSPDCRTVQVELSRNGDRLAIAVRDRGQGIPVSEQKSIFGKFVRGAEARAGGVKGTGIGLALARHIVEAHRGEISLASTPGQGSTFTILLPLEKKS